MKMAVLLTCISGIACVGCVSMRVTWERQGYERDPEIPRHAYGGAVVGGRHYAYLLQHDPDFGEYLVALVPSTNDVRVAKAALSYFAWKKPDREKFELVVRSIPPRLLSQEVDESSTDAMMLVSLSEFIDDTRRNKGWANQSIQHNALDHR